MIVKTRDFGELEMDESAIITFARPIYGFENLCKYAIIIDDEIGNSIVWLQSVEDENTCFILFNINDFGYEYDEELSAETKELLKVADEKDVIYLTMANIKESLEDATVNLKSPILLNTTTQLACQEILEKDYELRFQIFKKEEE